VGGVHRGKIVGVTQYGSEGDTFLRIALKSASLRPDLGVTDLSSSRKKPLFSISCKKPMSATSDG
jgi:hypothetical protein